MWLLWISASAAGAAGEPVLFGEAAEGSGSASGAQVQGVAPPSAVPPGLQEPSSVAWSQAALPQPIPGSGQPARFAGWLQPWTVVLIFGLPVLWALIERRTDLARFIRRRAWRRQGPET